MYLRTPILRSPAALEDGSLTESDGSDNSSDALAPDSGVESKGGTGIDFEFFSGESTEEKNPSTAKPRKQVEPPNVPAEFDETTGEKLIKDPLDELELVNDPSKQKKQDVKKAKSNSKEQPNEEEAGETDTNEESPQPKKRDYSRFTTEDATVLKQIKLPNSIFNAISPILASKKEALERNAILEKENKSFKDGNPEFNIPANWYDDPDAYQYTPQFKQTSALYNRAEYEASYWKEQLKKIERNEPWNLLAYDEKTGRYSVGQTIKPEPDHKVEVGEALQNAINIRGNAERQAAQIAQQFKTEVSKSGNYYEEQSAPKFAQLRDDLKPKDEHIKAYLDGFVLPQHRNTSQSKTMAKMFSLIINQATALAKLEKGNSVAARNKNDAIAAGARSKPTPSAGIQKVGAKGKDEEVDFDSLKEEMEN